MSDGIVPTLAELVALRGIASSGRQPRRSHATHAGIVPSPARGRGMEYAESREYTAGDDARHIDWRLTARTGRPHSKVFHAERERLTLLVADTPTSMYYGTRVRFKSVQAARAGAIVAWHAIGEGDRVAALRAGPREAPVGPAGGVRGALRLIDALVRWYQKAPEDDHGLEAALERARRLLRPGARLVVLTEGSSVAAIPASRWTGLAQHHDVVVLMMCDPIEMQPPSVVLPLETPDGRVEVPLGARETRARWLARFAAPVQHALRDLPSRGVRTFAMSTADASDSCLPLLRGRTPQVA